jgi:hypothetical protein
LNWNIQSNSRSIDLRLELGERQDLEDDAKLNKPVQL